MLFMLAYSLSGLVTIACLQNDGTYNYTKMASEMKTTSLEGASGMEIAGGSFGDVFFSAGAKGNRSDSKVCYLCWETNISPQKSHFWRWCSFSKGGIC